MIYLMSGYLCEFQEGNFRLKGDERIVRSYSSPIKKLSRQTGKSASRVNRFSHFMSSVQLYTGAVLSLQFSSEYQQRMYFLLTINNKHCTGAYGALRPNFIFTPKRH